MTPDEMRLEIALMLYQKGRLSGGKCAELAGKTRMEFQGLLAARDIPLNYDVADLEDDLRTLRRLGRL